MKIPILISILFFSYSVFSQDSFEQKPNKPLSDYSREMTYYELWAEILFSEDTLLEYNNVLVYANYADQARIDSLKETREEWIVKPKLIWQEIIFENGWSIYEVFTLFHIENIVFERSVIIEDCVGFYQPVFRGCKFKNGLSMTGNFAGILLLKCEINGFFNEKMSWKSDKKSDWVSDENDNIAYIDSCKFYLYPTKNSKYGYYNEPFFINGNATINNSWISTDTSKNVLLELSD